MHWDAPVGGGTRHSVAAESAAYLVASALGYLAADRFVALDGVSVWFPPAAITVVYLVRVGLVGVPVALATRLVASAAILPDQFRLGSAVLTGAFVTGAYALLAHGIRQRPTPLKARTEVLLLVLQFGGAALLAGAGAMAYAVATGPAALGDLPSMLWSFWLGDASALVTLAPALLLTRPGAPRRGPSERHRRAIGALHWLATLGAVVLAAYMAFAGGPDEPLFYPSVGPVVVMAMWRGLRSTAAVVAAVGAALPLAALAHDATVGDMRAVQVFLLAMAITGLGLGATESDRIATRRALEASEARLTAAVEQARRADALQTTCLGALEQGIVLATPTAGVVLMNRAAQAILQRDPVSLTAGFRQEGWVVQDEDGTPIPRDRQPLVHTVLTGEPVADQIVAFDREDGERVVLRVRTEPVHDEQRDFVGVVAAFADITAERAAERARAEAEQRFRSAFEEAPFGVQLASGQHVVEVNRHMCELSGRSREELLGVGVLPFLRADDAARLWRDFLASQAAGERVFSTEARLLRPDGEERWTRGTVVTVADGDGTDGAITHIVHIADINERHRAALAIAEAEVELRRSFEQSATPTAFVDAEGRLRRVNHAYCALLGRDEEDLVGRYAVSVVHPEDRRAATQAEDLELRMVRGDGTTIWTRVTTSTVRAADGSIDHYVGQVTDVTEARAAQAELRSSQERFAALVEHSADVIAVLDGDGRFTYLSPAGQRLLQEGRPLVDAVVPDDRAELTALLLEVGSEPGASRTVEVQVGTMRGTRHLELALTNRLDDPHVLGVVANMRDVTDRVEAAGRLEWQAFHDPLTGLPNRALLIERVEASLDRDRRTGHDTALLYVDLDRFKLVNDTLGHETGDNLLVVIANRLTRLIGERGTVARLGGDEFVILLEHLADRRHGTDLAEAVTAELAQPIRLGSTMVSAAASIGIAFDAGHTPETLLRDADTALYRAKDRGKGRYEVFDDSLRAAALRKVSTEALLRRALDDDQLQVHYQPVVDLVTGSLLGAEALLRVPGPGGELQSPAEFVVVADETGLIVPIGAGILDAACATLRSWNPDGLGPQHVAVNVSARQLASSGFAEVVERALTAHGLRGDQLVLELTESALIQADRATTMVIDRLHELGVGLAIDDFGTGYGSLAYLKRFPVTTVKIDQSFVAGLGTDANDTEIVRAITSLGRSLGLFVIAEGIETREQLAELQALGCDAGQGYLFSPALPAAVLHREADELVAAAFPGPTAPTRR